jgi:hypothetical protein
MGHGPLKDDSRIYILAVIASSEIAFEDEALCNIPYSLVTIFQRI